MAALPPRSQIGISLALCLLATGGGPAVAHDLRLRNAKVEPLSFAKLDGWKDDDHAVAFDAFLKSCGAILQGSKAMRAKRPLYGALFKVCERANAAGKLDRDKARAFFENNFKPVRILPEVHTYGYYTGADGFYTGYYEAEVAGSRVKTEDYNVPLYRVPAKLAGKKSTVFSQFDRTAIEGGALAGKGLEICWIKNPVDAFFAQIQGSTRVKLADGELLRLNYIASNGKPYTPVGRIMIDQGLCTPEEMSMDKIREFMEANPDEGKALREKNRSFVFFSETPLKPNEEPLGAQGIPLTPWRSLAVDPSIHVYGTPIWIDAKFPITSDLPQDTFQHLMFAQDTGSAIRGSARADIYFGHGEDTPHIAGRIKQFGKFVMLVPQGASVNGTAPEVAKDIPLPRPRPKDIVADNAAAGTAATAAQPKPRL
ncbi:MAG TPA: MltA domain-containing protein [Pseudolabrys sp.]|jgi:membrane-bound lytic murein transglycosylase A